MFTYLLQVCMYIWNWLKQIDSNLIAIILAVAGWLFALYKQNKDIKLQLETQIKYDVYKQLVSLHKEIQNSLSILGAKSRPPFILMDSCMIPFELKLKKEYKGQWIEHSELECVLKGNKKWTEFINETNKEYFDFSDKYISMLYILEDWMGPIKELVNTKGILIKEINEKKDRILKNINNLRNYSKEYDWRKWNKEEVNKISDEINVDSHTISMYINDFMILIHNELLSNYFKYTRPTRKTFDEKYKVLTKDGIITNLEKDPKKIKEFNKIISEINKGQNNHE